MEIKDAEKILKSIGLSTNMILALVALGVGFYMYRNYYETVKLQYQIKALKNATTINPSLLV